MLKIALFSLIYSGCRSMGDMPDSTMTSTLEDSVTSMPTTGTTSLQTRPTSTMVTTSGQEELNTATHATWMDFLPIHSDMPIVDVYSGGTYGMAITANNRVWGWGVGNLFDLNTDELHIPQLLPTHMNIRHISTLPAKIAFVDVDGNILLRSSNSGDTLSLKGISDVEKAVLYSEEVMFVLTTTGAVWVKGKLGEPIFPFDNFQVSNGDFQRLMVEDIVDIKVGNASLLLRDNYGSLWIWGKTGIEDNSEIFYTPSIYESVSNVRDMALGFGLVVVLDDGAVWQSGYGYDGKLVPITNEITRIVGDVGTANNYAIDKDGRLWGWGRLSPRLYPEAPTNLEDFINQPVPISLPRPLTRVSLLGSHLLMLDVDNTVWTWSDRRFNFHEMDVVPPNDKDYPIPIITSGP